MTSSGMKRGLAVSAISALAMTGLPFMAGTANASTLASQAGGDNSVVVYTPADGDFASVKNDGVNTTVHLLANGGANVVSVQFQYRVLSTDAWTNIGSPVARANGAFSTEWTPSTAIYNLPTTEVRAVALGSVGTEIGASSPNGAVVSSGAESIDIANAPGSAIGVYIDGNSQQGAVSGTTSDVAADPTLSFSSPSSTGAPTSEDVVGTPAGGVRSYSAPVNFDGYTWDTNAADGTVNEAVVYGKAQGSDAEAITLYKQTLGEVTAVAVPTSPQSGNASTVTVTVTDQNGLPVVGADVIQEGATPVEKPTNSQGQAKFSVTDTNANGGSTFAYFVDENGNNTWDSGDEFRRTVTVSDYTPAATSIVGDSHDGSAFDFDEYAAAPGTAGEGDITVTVKDQNGAPLKGQTLTGRWTITPFDGSAATTAPATITDADADGIYDVAFPGVVEGTYKLNVWIEKDGTPGETAGDMSMTPLTFKAGQAEIVWADGATAQRAAGSTATFEATMQLDDATGLPGRNVAITWTKNATGNAVVAAQAAQPANTTRTGDSTATSKTDSNGTFGVAISDPAANPNVDELNGSLDAVGTDTTGIGNSAAPADALDVDFLKDATVSTTTSTATQDALDAGNLQSPGRPVAINLTIKNADGTLLTDVPVSASTDHGFFTTPDALTLSDLKPAPAAAEGANYGEWENLGDKTETKTDDTGKARVVVAIERDAGFDDNGLVTAKVTFNVGGKTITQDVVFDSSNPMNPGEVDIELAPAAMQTISVLPKAPTTERVAFYAQATDQFGNLTDVTLKLDDNTANATVENAAGTEITSITSQFTNEVPGVYGDGSAPTSQVISGLWDNAATLTWTDAQPATAGFQEETAGGVDGTKAGTKDVADDSTAIEWYDINYATSHYTLDSGDSTRTVGDTVHTTFTAVDQMGEPITGLDVHFFRTGPDDLQDGEGKAGIPTDDNGESTYIWQGAKAGTAVVTSVVRTSPTGALIPQAELSDSVTFAAVRSSIDAGLKLGNQKDGDDVAMVTAPAAAKGATVRLYKVKADGTRKLVATKTANRYGDTKFVVSDAKPNKVTKYIAKVGATARTFADWTPKASIR